MDRGALDDPVHLPSARYVAARDRLLRRPRTLPPSSPPSAPHAMDAAHQTLIHLPYPVPRERLEAMRSRHHMRGWVYEDLPARIKMKKEGAAPT